MPELPDVETFKRFVDDHALGQIITHTSIRDHTVLGRATAQRIYKALHHRRFLYTHRHGKYLFIKPSGRDWLVLHFGMTGRLYYYQEREPEPAYNVMVIYFKNHRHLAYNSRRKLGTIDLTRQPRAFIKERDLGADALALDEQAFLALLQGRRGIIKNFLMDQHHLAGLGNVYTDELLFHASVHPRMPLQALNDKTRRRLYAAMHKILRKAIDVRADLNRLPRTFLLPHRRKDGRCPRCGVALRSISISGRTTYFCPAHQPRGTRMGVERK